MIEGVKTKKLNLIPDDRGRLMEILRTDDEAFDQFGQVYLSTTYPGVVKAWHFHKLQKDNFACVKGMIRLVLADTRESSPTKGEINEFYIGELNPTLVQVPIGVYHGWKCVGTEEAFIINVCTKTYNYKEPDEYRLPAHDNSLINYDWSTKDR
ncbi:MAG TPA: dTDP-4-dehydrorhamnose 3,5-epimerase family protein [Acidobacteriota bacterium]|jgi:dTDP-4-dehydrorhamnose 3,5-epimerase|nr:dTDP-4-dehydrorhamnose 3,5-epimerase family protein [Acidobacteriota bacterium]HNT17574.1 dTDP-4-dehydrorhamnose 3,5-epimerase family protein [Acidobacteriota bacterium]HPA26971.1 dTDP-4-dehydrorhamnose 3,5-epimerase family protein [Acidobacteriota bacterium]